ncbi:MAG TPA: zf-HC2 domain-containing protein [Vicinamibacterales bacterium]|nr:zf-HC2 domain-containing protein [Vicinamibacterales bacterium]
MACQQYRSSIQDLVDGTIGPIRRAELEQHLEVCADCRALLEDLERLRDVARSLDDRPPPDGAWLQIAARLRQEGRVRDLPRVSGSRMRIAALAMAAAIVIVAGAVLLFVARGRQAPASAAPATAAANTGAPGNAAPPPSVESVEAELDQAEQHYETAIKGLQQITASGQQSLDPQVARTLNKNVQVVDQAIAESRAALRAEPASVTARNSLFDALRQKVALLQDTIALMNEMRKGNQAGAAQIVEGRS